MAKSKATLTIGGVTFNTETIKKVKILFRKLGHKQKQIILKKIGAAGPEGICVQDIYQSKGIDLGQSHASIILAELKKEKLVNFTRKGKNVYYTLNERALLDAKQICDLSEMQEAREQG